MSSFSASNIAKMNFESSVNVSNTLAKKQLEKIAAQSGISRTEMNKIKTDDITLGYQAKQSGLSKLNTANKHVQDTKTILDKADEGLKDTESNLKRMKEIAEEVSSGKLSTEDLAKRQKEFTNLKEKVAATADNTEFNKHKLLDGSMELVTQTKAIGGENRSIKIQDMSTKALGISDASIDSPEEAKKAIESLEKASKAVGDQRSAISVENKALEKTSEKLGEINKIAEKLTSYEEAMTKMNNLRDLMLSNSQSFLNMFNSSSALQSQNILRLL